MRMHNLMMWRHNFSRWFILQKIIIRNLRNWISIMKDDRSRCLITMVKQNLIKLTGGYFSIGHQTIRIHWMYTYGLATCKELMENVICWLVCLASVSRTAFDLSVNISYGLAACAYVLFQCKPTTSWLCNAIFNSMAHGQYVWRHRSLSEPFNKFATLAFIFIISWVCEHFPVQSRYD